MSGQSAALGLLNGYTDNDKRVPSIVLIGSIIGAIAAIIEYNLSGIVSDPYTVRYGIIIGGIVSGFLSGKSWKLAAKFGGFAGAIPVAILAPVVFFFVNAEMISTAQPDGGILFWAIGSLFLIYPGVILIGTLLGLLGGLVGYLISSLVPVFS